MFDPNLSPPEPEAVDRDYFDYVVIGGGPAGSTLATLLVRSGRSVLLLESARFPRVTVGEIIAPTALWRVWHALGISQETLDAMFIRKWRGAWQSAGGTVFRFEQDVHPDDDRCRPFVYTLDRGPYDAFLLDHAVKEGVVGLQEVRVDEVFRADSGRVDGVVFTWRGQQHRVRTRIVLDATGRVNFLGRALNLRMDFEELKSFAVFGHYIDTARAEGDAEGDIRILFGKDMWFWWAPLKSPKTSVGVVANREVYWEEYARDPEAFYEKYVASHPYIAERIGERRRITEIKPIPASYAETRFNNYHYFCSRLIGDGYAIVGDAAGFIDPIFSAGLFISQSAAWYLSDALLAVPDDRLPTEEDLKPYEERYFREFGDNLNHIRWFATSYFEPSFVDFFLNVGNRSEDMRQLYIDTFIAYDPGAIQRFGRLMKRFSVMAAQAAPAEARP